MTLTLDQAGRVELPQPVLDQLGLLPGAKLEMQVEANGELRLRPASAKSNLLMTDGVLVHRGQAVAELDWNAAIELEREERLRALAG